MTKTTPIQLFDDTGALIASMDIKAYEIGKRHSVWCANAQRKLDKLIAENPTAKTAKIGPSDFTVKNGRSQYVL